jgi:UDP-glucose 4-epimerase
MPPMHTRPRAVAVLGARGFIGRTIASTLARHGVPTVSRGSQAPAVQHGELDPEVAAAATVVVVTGRSSPAQAEQEPATAATELAEGRELFDLLARPRPGGERQRVLLASSGGAVYDTEHPAPFDERSPTARSSAYARLKLDLEEAFLAGAGETSERCVLRLSNVYGPGQRMGTGQGVVGYWFRALLDDEPIRLFGDPETIRDYVYVDDVAEAFVAAHSSTRPLPPVVNIGSGEPTSLRALVHVLLRAAQRPGHDVQMTEDRPFDRRHTWLDVRTAAGTLGWRPTTTLQDGLAATWEQAVRSRRGTARSGRPAGRG